MLKLISRYGYRFLVNRNYRSYVLQMLRERSAPTQTADEFYLSNNNDFSNLKGLSVFMCGGCELTFIGDHFRLRGLEVYHTFENGRTAEPLVEVSSAGSVLFTRQFDAVIFCETQSFMQIIQKIQSAGARYGDEERERDFRTLLVRLRGAIERVNAMQRVPIFLVSHFFIHRRYRGAHEFKGHSTATSFEEMNLRYAAALYEIARSFENVYILDVNAILEVEGKKRALEHHSRSGIFDHPTKFGARLVAEEALYQLLAMTAKTRRVKCAVFDLDDTLWGGILREDGAANLAPRWGCLHVTRALAARGILVAVCSKNDPEDAALVEQILGKDFVDQLVSMKLNWKPKSVNIRQIANELNIGLDAIVFFDDNPVEREEVRANAPGVTVMDEVQIMAALDMAMFEPIGLVTEESAARTQMYKEQAQRAAAEAEAEIDPASIAQYYKSCDFRLDIRRPDAAMTTRIEELIQRTNQLNATGNRTTRAMLTQYLDNPSQYHVASASLKDKFGDYGLIGVCIARRDARDWEIIEFDFSCRAMGKHVEHALLAHLCRAVGQRAGSALTVRFRKTPRNREMRLILQEFGFQATQENDEAIELRHEISGDKYGYPEWLQIDGEARAA
jgi:FkbH-like protein